MSYYIWEVKPKVNPFVDKDLKKRILKNPAQLEIAVGDYPHHKASKYSRYTGSCNRLAEMMITGAYKGGVPRPFMFKAMELLKKDREYKKSIKYYMDVTRGKNGGVTVDWDGIGINTVFKVRQLLTQGKLGLFPIAKDSLRKRTKAGHNAEPPLVASGQLADAITYKINGK